MGLQGGRHRWIKPSAACKRCIFRTVVNRYVGYEDNQENKKDVEAGHINRNPLLTRLSEQDEAVMAGIAQEKW